jgi:hypothetical protein
MISTTTYILTNPLLASFQRGGKFIGFSIFFYITIVFLGFIGYWSAMQGFINFHNRLLKHKYFSIVYLILFFFIMGITIFTSQYCIGSSGGTRIPYFYLVSFLGSFSLISGLILGQNQVKLDHLFDSNPNQDMDYFENI